MNSVQRVRSILKQRGIAVYKMEKDLGFGNGYISQLRKGVFPDDRLVMIANYLDLPVSFLTGEEEEKKENPATNGDEVLSAKQIEMIEKIKGMSKEEFDKKFAALSAIFDI